MKEQVQQFLEKGYCYYEGVLDARDQENIRRAMDAYWRAQGGGGTDKPFGFTIHPLLTNIPELAPYLAHPLIEETLRILFDDDVRIAHAGARMSDEASEARLVWHNHYAWDETELVGRLRPTRALAGFYVDGTEPEIGSLVALPRAVGEPLGPQRGDAFSAWPGEQHVIMPPGSISIFDTALWHSAVQGTRPGMRRTFGAHYQGWSNDRPHPEDNVCDVPEVSGYKEKDRRLAGMLSR